MQVGYHSISWGGVVGEATGVTSVKDLYYRLPDRSTAITDIAAAGYAGIEMFDGNVADYADRPEVLQGLLADAGLELVSAYTGGNFVYADILDDELHRVRTPPSWRNNSAPAAWSSAEGPGEPPAPGRGLHRLGGRPRPGTDIAEQRGLTACYHPHLTTIVESPDELDRLMPQTRIGFCPDTAHLAAGGGDPAELIRRYPDRVAHVHLKDVRLDPVAFVPLGQGVDRLRRRLGGAQRGRLRRMADRRTRLLRRRSRPKRRRSARPTSTSCSLIRRLTTVRTDVAVPISSTNPQHASGTRTQPPGGS